MRSTARLFATFLMFLVALCGFGMISRAQIARASEPAPGGLFDTPLVVSGSPTEGEQRRAEGEARLTSPEAVTAREASQTSFEGLDSDQAAKLAGEAFPEVVDRRAGALPPLPSGQRIVAYPTDSAAQVDLGSGKHGVIEATEPIAIQSSSGQREPLDLSLGEVGGAFAPMRSGVGLRIPKNLADGVQLPATGVSLTPVDANGAALAGSEGALDGATVLYANTQTDSDTVVKPLAVGFEEDTLLRSENSPTQLSFQVGLPSGATLVAAKDGSGAIEVLDQRTVLAALPAPTAHDADGVSVPVTVTVSDGTLTLGVAHHGGAYRYPIAVDPTVAEKGGYEGEVLYRQSWNFFTENPAIFKVAQLETGKSGLARYLEDVVSKSVAVNERAFFYYPTQGESRIYAVSAETEFEGFAGGKMENVLGIYNVHTAKPEVSQAWIENYFSNPTLCVEAGCAAGTVSPANNKSEVFYSQDTRENNEWAGGTSKLWRAAVYISQEAGPSSNFIPVEKWVNNQASTWLSLNATDPGLGISSSEWTSPGNPEWKSNVFIGGCAGVQCEECYSATCGKAPISGNLKGLPDGEDVVNTTTKDPVGLTTTASTTVKIDNVELLVMREDDIMGIVA